MIKMNKKMDKMSEDIIRYVCKNFIDKFNEKEKLLYNLFITSEIVEKVYDDFQKKQLLKKLKIETSDLDFIKLLDYKDFLHKTVMRVIEEEEIYLNLCPICGQIARTPQANKGKCGHHW